MTSSELGDGDWPFLLRAIDLGRRGWGRVHPNPMVGCVIVRDGSVLSEGWHGEFGGPHAEAVALEAAGSVTGATAYVSLEPCSHHGKTPPCTTALANAGIGRVVYWARDPGSESGGGGDWLRGEGIAVSGPHGKAAEWAAENPFFFFRSKERPYLAAKIAVSMDGGIAPGPGKRRWLTGESARDEVHRLRAGFDGILVGRGTWQADDPRLTVRGGLQPRNAPVRVLLDTKGELAGSAAVFEDARAPVWVATAEESVDRVAERLGDRATAVPVPRAARGLDAAALLRELRARGLRTVLCEGGGLLLSSLLSRSLVDRVYLFQSPTFLGDGRVPAFPRPADGDRGSPGDPDRWQRARDAQRFDGDVLITLDRST